MYGITEHGRELLVDAARRSGHRRQGLPPQGGVLRRPRPRPAASSCSSAAGPAWPRSSPPPAPGRRRSTERVDGYLRSLREHDTQTIEHEIAWLDGLIADEREHLRADGPVTSQEDTTE